jgi:hypothetical protein
LRGICLLSHIIEGKIRGTRRGGRRRKQLLDNLKEARRYWKLKDRILWRTEFGGGKADYYLNMVPRRIFGPRGEHCIMRSFVTCTRLEVYLE